MKNNIDKIVNQSYKYPGLFTLALRLVVGWTYFSAFWRRLVLEYKLDPEVAGYIGGKFNTFLPNALGIKPIIHHLVTHPELLWWAMAAFTIIEGIVGLLFMFGFFTRLMSVGVFSLAMGILLGSGWLGTTCLDEWQIGVLGIAAGFTIFLTGSSHYSLDHWLSVRNYKITRKKWFRWIGSGELPMSFNKLNKAVLTGSLLILFVTLFTNQYFSGGVWGTLHNKSVKPKIEITDASIHKSRLSFTVFRVEGVDVYGSFLIGINLKNKDGKTVLQLNGEELAHFPVRNIKNDYIEKVKPGAHSLIIPLGAKATINVDITQSDSLSAGMYQLTLTDISGAEWKSNVGL